MSETTRGTQLGRVSSTKPKAGFKKKGGREGIGKTTNTVGAHRNLLKQEKDRLEAIRLVQSTHLQTIGKDVRKLLVCVTGVNGTINWKRPGVVL